MRTVQAIRLVAISVIIAFIAACSSLPIGEYSLDAYKNATSLKAETLAIIDKAKEPYRTHQSEVEALTTKIDSAYEFSAGMPNNQLSAQQWNILRDPAGNLYGGFVRLWKKQGTVSDFYRSEEKAQIGAAFDEIICLEANKQAPSKCGAAK